MAEASVGESFLFLQPLLDKISSPVASEYFFSYLDSKNRSLSKLKSNLLSFNAILEAAESREYQNIELKLWLDGLKVAIYTLEDFLNEVQLEAKEDIQSQRKNAVLMKSRWIYIFMTIEVVQRHKENFGLANVLTTARKLIRQPPTSSLVTIPKVIGRDRDKDAILDLLFAENAPNNHTDVISIVGMSGVGKTTLAQFVYNDNVVDCNFELKGWVCASDELDVFHLTKTLLEVLARETETSDIKDLSALQTKLKENLSMKRFLLILDDVRREEFSLWEMMLAPLLAGTEGSKIIVTTQFLPVARMMAIIMGSTLPAYRLKSLSNEDSRMLFAEHAFENKDSGRLYPELEDIGSDIVKKCEGLPLATVTLGRMLHSKPVAEWVAVLNANIFKLLYDRSDIFAALTYSLPPHIKRCFAYCSLFPRDYEYEEENLIRLWMAEGLVRPSNYKRIEDVGHDYFVDLTSRFFFQQSSTSKSHFVMNSLLNDLAQFLSGEFFLRWVNHETTSVSCKVRHLSFAGGLHDETWQAICKAKSVRTLLSYEKFSIHLSSRVPSYLFEALESLWVLSLSHYHIIDLPESIGSLKLLQYLDLSYTQITTLPDIVSTLYNLQTLLLSYCRCLAGLPMKMGNLVNLRHLDIRETSLKEMPVDMGQLTSLQSLSDFVVGKHSGSKIKELKPLLNLRGTLHISQLQNVVPAGDAYEASLKNKAHLQGLELEWSNAAVDSQNETGVLEQLEPHKNLEKLSIISYSGIRFPDWLGDPSFSKMVFLRLSNCNSCFCLPPLGKLPSLKELEIEGMNGIKRVGPEFYGMNPSSDKPFPSLEILVFRELVEWEEWISPEVEVENFPCLKQISISGCLKLAKCLPLRLPPSAEVEISECPLLKVPVTDGNKMQFGCDNKLALIPPMPPVYGEQLTNDDEIDRQYLEHRTDVSSTSHNSPPELSKLSTELALPKLPVMVEKQVHEGNSRKEKLLDRPSTSRLSEVEELQLPDINVVQSTDVSIKSSRPTPESPTRLTEDSSAKHEDASDLSDISSSATDNLSDTDTDTDTDDPINDGGDKAQFRIQGIEKLQLPQRNVVRGTDVSATSNNTSQKSCLTEDSNAKHVGADTDDPINDGGNKAQFRIQGIEKLQPQRNVVRKTDVSAPSNNTSQKSCLTEDSNAKHVGADTDTEISSDTDTDDAINVSEISQLERLPRKLYSLKIESCKDLESLEEELTHNNLQQLYIIDCQYLKSIQASHLPIALKTLYIRRCKKLEFLSAEETTGKHTSVEHLCIESSCDPLKSFPLALFPKLRNLSICDCANFNSISITEDHNTLNSLEIRDCKNLESLWKSGLGTPKLTSILLSNCKKLKQLPGQLHGLTSLQSLFIKECPELDSIPVGGLPSSLNLLRISSCHKLTPCLQWGLRQLKKFIRFEIEGGCGDLESFPEQNLLPVSLNSLEISTFPNLKVLNYEGLQHLTSLRTLKINSCDKLQFLPEEGLPSSLSYLYISDCPLLKSKLQNKRGSEWFKIAHIPHIQIDGKVIS